MPQTPLCRKRNTRKISIRILLTYEDGTGIIGTVYIVERGNRMSRRLLYCLIALLCMLGVLLLLSAFAGAPGTEEAIAEEPPVAHSFATFFSMPPSPTTASPVLAGEWLRVAALFAATILTLPCLQCICDANGRILCQKRYVRSFYPVFKQDLACG